MAGPMTVMAGAAGSADGMAGSRGSSVSSGLTDALLSCTACATTGGWDPGSCMRSLGGSVPGSGNSLGGAIVSAHSLEGSTTAIAVGLGAGLTLPDLRTGPDLAAGSGGVAIGPMETMAGGVGL